MKLQYFFSIPQFIVIREELCHVKLAQNPIREVTSQDLQKHKKKNLESKVFRQRIFSQIHYHRNLAVEMREEKSKEAGGRENEMKYIEE